MEIFNNPTLIVSAVGVILVVVAALVLAYYKKIINGVCFLMQKYKRMFWSTAHDKTVKQGLIDVYQPNV
ncbi:hypothetical protein AN168_07125 [Vibrio splendidus]|uniref:Uncharacterized protein n=1 Tax=Vibrio splendidus TaxID=29497 RepID=A0A837NXD5_VIBSP|nr:hypothetical protein AN168_07125 [Vibrio splendidus]